MTLILVGNYGDGNIGDEALREYFLTHYSSYTWNVVSASPQGEAELHRLPGGVRSFFSGWPRTLYEIFRSDGLVFGGGTLFTDSESIHACVLWFSYALIAFCTGTPFSLAFQGIGPFRTRIARWMTQWVVSRAAFISVRDEASYERVLHMGRHDAVLTFDPAFVLPYSLKRTEKSPHSLAIIPRANPTESFMRECEACIRRHAPTSLLLLSLQPTAEAAVLQRLRALFLSLGVKPEVHSIHSWQQLCDLLAPIPFVITQRYHGAIFSLALDIPFLAIPIADGDKLSQLSSLNREECRERCLRGEHALKAALASTEH